MQNPCPNYHRLGFSEVHLQLGKVGMPVTQSPEQAEAGGPQLSQNELQSSLHLSQIISTCAVLLASSFLE